MKIWRKARGAKGSLATINIRACFRKILQHDFLHHRSSRCWNINLQAKASYSTASTRDGFITVSTRFSKS
jgi:Ribosomal L28 family